MPRVATPKKSEPITIETLKNGRIRYRVRTTVGTRPDGRPHQIDQKFDTLGDAREHLDLARRQVRQGVFVKSSNETVTDFGRRWVSSRQDIRENSRLGYASVLRNVEVRMGERKISSLTRADIEAWLLWMAGPTGGVLGRGVSHRTLQYALGALKQVLDRAVEDNVLVANPAERVSLPRKKSSEAAVVPVWNLAQLQAFRVVADADPWAAGWRLTLSGLRRSEVMGMRWDAVDLVAGTVEVRRGRVILDGHRTADDDPKSSASFRTVDVEEMHQGSIDILRKMKIRQAADRLAAGEVHVTGPEYVLRDELGTPVRPDAYSDRFAELCVKAGVPTIPLHNVRHSLALMLHEDGVPPVHGAALLGHTLQVHLSTYLPPDGKGASSAATRFGALSGAR